MEKGTRFRVKGPLDWFDAERGIEVGDTGTCMENRSDIPWCQMDKPVRSFRDEIIRDIRKGYDAVLGENQLEPISTDTPKLPRKSPKRQETSIQAHKSQKDKAPGDCAKILKYLGDRATGRTCDHVERVLRMSHQTASARIRDLSKAGKIVDSGRREKTRTGRSAICWKVVV